MRKKAFSNVRHILSWIIVFVMLINSSPINAGAAQNVSDNPNEQVYDCDGYSITFKIDTVWNSGYNVSVVIQNTGEEAINDWYMYLKYDGEIPNMWNAIVYERTAPYMILTNAIWNKDIYSGGTASFGFTGSGDFPGFPEAIIITSGYDPDALESLGVEHGDDGGDTPDDGVDTDGDGLSDAFEDAIGSNPELIDTDGDGLSDYQEVYLTGTDPILTDTDGDGIDDANEDEDGDCIKNFDEISRGTDAMHPDSDRDDLNDYDDIYTYGCDPLNSDTDGDGLCDGDDVLLGFSPTMPDTDLNGILDSAEKIYQTTENNFEFEDTHGLTSVSISLNASGNADKEVEITNLYEFDSQSRNVVGLIGAPIEITSDVAFDTATITFSYDESMLGDTLEENLSLMWYDEENHWYQILDQDSVVDTVNNTVSYTTTHFSKYLLVDISKWFETWNGDIEYSEEEPTDITYTPTRYLVIEDTYSFVSSDDSKLIEEIKKTLSEFSYTFSLYEEGQIRMENGLGRHWNLYGNMNTGTREYFTGDGYTITPGEDADIMSHPGYRSPNLNEIINSIIYTYDKYPEYYSSCGFVIFFISNRNSGASEEMLQKCVERGIKIYTIDIGNDGEKTALKNLSTKTFGSYNYGEITHNPILLVNTMVYMINGLSTYGTDRDTDGLLDIYEIEGVRTLTGKLITTNPENGDTDGDNLSDYDEVGQVYDLNLYIGRGVIKNCKFVIPNSDPNLKDTDGDDIPDNEDPYPQRSLYKETTIHSVYDNVIYLNIDGFPGGNQNWWNERGDFSGYTDDIDHYLVSPGYRMVKHGCGVIAMSDLEIFLAQNYGLHAIYDKPIPSYNEDGCISRRDYMMYADYNRDNVYLHELGGYPHGVRTYEIYEGLQNYLMANYIIAPNVTYAASYEKDDVMNSIIWMIDNNLPIVCLYNSKSGNDKLCYYKKALHAIYNDDYIEDDGCYSHYFNIIGYVKYYDEEYGIKYLLEIESANTIYYVNYDEYANQLSYGCNVFLYHL